jgi:hypothetical protein
MGYRESRNRSFDVRPYAARLLRAYRVADSLDPPEMAVQADHVLRSLMKAAIDAAYGQEPGFYPAPDDGYDERVIEALGPALQEFLDVSLGFFTVVRDMPMDGLVIEELMTAVLEGRGLDATGYKASVRDGSMSAGLARKILAQEGKSN